MKKEIATLMFILIIWGLSLQGYQGKDKLMLTLFGDGNDPIFEIQSMVGETISFHVPGKIERVQVDQKSDWLMTEESNVVYIQPRKEAVVSFLQIVVRYERKMKIFIFKIFENSANITEKIDQVHVILGETSDSK